MTPLENAAIVAHRTEQTAIRLLVSASESAQLANDEERRSFLAALESPRDGALICAAAQAHERAELARATLHAARRAHVSAYACAALLCPTSPSPTANAPRWSLRRFVNWILERE